jgi:hypothetical protein
MASHGPNATLRRRIETGIRLASPVLDLVILVGDRVSRLLEREDPEYVPARMQRFGESAPRGLRPRAPRPAAERERR